MHRFALLIDGLQNYSARAGQPHSVSLVGLTNITAIKRSAPALKIFPALIFQPYGKNRGKNFRGSLNHIITRLSSSSLRSRGKACVITSLNRISLAKFPICPLSDLIFFYEQLRLIAPIQNLRTSDNAQLNKIFCIHNNF